MVQFKHTLFYSLMKLRSQIIKLRQMLSLVAEHFPNLPAGKCFTDTNDKVKAESKKALNLHLRHILHYIQKSTYYSYSTVLQEIRKKNKKSIFGLNLAVCIDYSYANLIIRYMTHVFFESFVRYTTSPCTIKA